MKFHHHELGLSDIRIGDIVDDAGWKCVLAYIPEVDLADHNKMEGLKNYRPYVTIDLDTGCEICRYRTLKAVNSECKLLRQNKDVKITI